MWLCLVDILLLYEIMVFVNTLDIARPGPFNISHPILVQLNIPNTECSCSYAHRSSSQTSFAARCWATFSIGGNVLAGSGWCRFGYQVLWHRHRLGGDRVTDLCHTLRDAALFTNVVPQMPDTPTIVGSLLGKNIVQFTVTFSVIYDAISQCYIWCEFRPTNHFIYEILSRWDSLGHSLM